MFEVHRETRNVNEECKNGDIRTDTMCGNETHPVEAVTEISNTESGTKERAVEEKGNTPERKTSDEKYLQGKEEGKSFSKESDVDSGCDSCHEVYNTEPSITHAQLDVSSLVHCHAQKIDTINSDKFTDKVSGHSLVDQVLESSPQSTEKHILNETKTELRNGEVEKCERDEDWSEYQKSHDSFEELINLAKDGMSTLARKRVDDGNKKKKIKDCFPNSSTDDAQRNDQNLDSRTESGLCLDAREVDSGVKCASSISLCLNDTNSTIENQSDSTVNKTLRGNSNDKQSDVVLTARKHPDTSMDKTSECFTTEKQSTKSEVAKISNNATQEQSNITTDLATYEVKIPAIAIESDSQATNDSIDRSKYPVVLALEADKNMCQDLHEVKNGQHMEENTRETSSNSAQQPKTLVKKHVTLRIQESLLSNGQIPEIPDRPKSLVIPSNETIDSDNKTVYGLKVPSLETLNLPSHGKTTEHGGRIRSFSATIRRKLSFRERVSSDDSDIEKQDPVTKNKKILGFRSFRVNRKKKTKAFKSEEFSYSTGCLSDSKKYLSTTDKIFQENTGSAIFTDLPFTIPE